MADDREKWLNGILSNFDYTGLGSTPPTPQVKKVEGPVGEDKVFLQKLVTEVWVYTDLDKKNYGTTSIQDIVILGEMTRDEAMQIIEDRKGKKRKKSD